MDKFILCGFILFLNLFFFHRLGSLGLALLFLGTFIYFLAIFGKRFKEQKKNLLIFSGILFAFLLLLVVRASPFVEFVLAVSSFFLIILFSILCKDKITFFDSLYQLLLVPFNFALSYLQAGVELVLHTEKPTSKKDLSYLVKGLIMGIPIVLVLLWLFSLADPIFNHFIQNINSYLSKFITGRFWNRLLLSLLFAGIFAPFLYFFKKTKKFASPVTTVKFSFAREISVVMILVGLTLGLFIVIQWPYVFANVPFETDLSKLGIVTYSEYVKKGFIELLFISLVIYSLIWIGLTAIRQSGEVKSKLLYWVQMIILGEFFLILLSIFRRIYLYQLYHGWSLGRIYGGMFLIWVLLMSITLLLRHLTKKRLVNIELAFSGLLVIIIGLFNAENYIVKNHPPTVNKRIDYVYLSRMDSDGYLGWVKSYEYAQRILVDNRELVKREDRREIAYSGLILRQLIRHYHQLSLQYANDAGMRDYLELIYDDQKDIHTQFYLDSNNPEKAKKTEKYFQEKISQLKNPSFNSFSLVYEIRTNQRFWPASFSPDIRMKYYDLFLYDFPIDDNQSRSQLLKNQYSTLDKLFCFNWSDKVAYQKIKDEIGITNLLSLYQKYVFLYEKIARQPATEREYDIDISFNTPLL